MQKRKQRQNTDQQHKHETLEKGSQKTRGSIPYDYQMKFGPIWETAFSHPAAHIWGPSTAIANGVRIRRDSIDKQA